jgi:ABC-type glycerol-3-phosphate transport system permease component
VELGPAREAASAPLAGAGSVRSRGGLADIAVYVLLVALAIVMLFPYVWMISNSFKPREQFYTNPYAIIPEVVTLNTYAQALTIGRVGIYLKNSAIYAMSVVVVQLLIDSLAAFAFARLRFPGRDLLFALFLSTMMLPFSVLLIPSYLLIHAIGLTNSYLGVVLPGFAGVFGIFLLRQFFLNIPAELEDAARIDGAGLLMTYARIIMPLAQPALITLGVFLFMAEWSAYLWPLIVLNDWNKYPLTVGIALYRDMSNIEWTNVFAASTLASFPVIVLFVLAQRYIVGGINLSGMKG